jgi:hypothetical protein
MRQARGFMSLLLRVQAERRKREADNAATDRAAWTEHCAAGLMAQALAAARDPAIPGAAPPVAAADPPPPPAPDPAEEPPADPVTEAERCAVIYPCRAALIRRLGRVPDNVSFGPPDDGLVHALVTGRTPTLLALDQPAEEALAE